MRKLVNRFKKLKNERGLTLVELLAVIVILAIVAVIAFVMIGNVIENSKKDAHISNAQQIIAAAKIYEASGNKIGANRREGVKVSQLQDEGFLDDIIDPWNNSKVYSGSIYVTKDTEGYKINDYVGSDRSSCPKFDATEQELAERGRKLCEN